MKPGIISTVIFVLFIKVTGFSQRPDPVHFTFTAVKMPKKDKKTKGVNYELHFTASMDKKWHIYSQTQPAEAIALPTRIGILKNPLIILLGIPKETGAKERYEDKITGIAQYQYGGTVDFVQAMQLKSPVKTAVSGSITYQACTEEMCLPPKTVEFNIPLR